MDVCNNINEIFEYYKIKNKEDAEKIKSHTSSYTYDSSKYSSSYNKDYILESLKIYIGNHFYGKYNITNFFYIKIILNFLNRDELLKILDDEHTILLYDFIIKEINTCDNYDYLFTYEGGNYIYNNSIINKIFLKITTNNIIIYNSENKKSFINLLTNNNIKTNTYYFNPIETIEDYIKKIKNDYGEKIIILYGIFIYMNELNETRTNTKFMMFKNKLSGSKINKIITIDDIKKEFKLIIEKIFAKITQYIEKKIIDGGVEGLNKIKEYKKQNEKQKLQEEINKTIILPNYISFENIDTSLIENIKRQNEELINTNNSIIMQIDTHLQKHSHYKELKSSLENINNATKYNIIFNSNMHKINAELSEKEIDKLISLLLEYITKFKPTENLSVLSNEHTYVAGGSHNLRHSIDLIIQSFKKQRPSLNINPDLLYNCILSSSKKNKNKPLRKYNQRTKR